MMNSAPETPDTPTPQGHSNKIFSYFMLFFLVVAFLFGFFRRDYGAAGLYDLQKTGALSVHQLTVAAITLTLFLPCVAQFLVMQKERGTRTTLWISAGVLVTAFTVGWLTHQALLLFPGGLP